MKRETFFLFLFSLFWVACSQEDPKKGQGEPIPPKLLLDDILTANAVSNIILTLTDNSGDQIAVISTDQQFIEGEAKFLTGNINFDYELVYEGPDTFQVTTTLTSLFNGVLQDQVFTGTNFSTVVDPGVYIIKIGITSTENESYYKELKSSMISQCVNPTNFTFNANAAQITAINELPLKPYVPPTATQYFGRYRFSINAADAIGAGAMNQNYVVYWDTDGDFILDKGPVSAGSNNTYYAVYASHKQIKIRMVDYCGTITDGIADIAGAFETTENEVDRIGMPQPGQYNFETSFIDNNTCSAAANMNSTLTWPLCPALAFFPENFVQLDTTRLDNNITVSGETNPQLRNGKLHFWSDNDYAVVGNFIGSSTFQLTATPTTNYLNSNTSNLLGQYDFYLNINGLQRDSSGLWLEQQPNANVNSLTISYPGAGDHSDPYSVTTSNCEIDLKIPSYIDQVAPCGEGYEGPGYTYHSVWVHADFNCPLVTNNLPGVSEKSLEIPGGEFLFKISNGLRTGRCTRIPSPPTPPTPTPPGPPGPIPTPPPTPPPSPPSPPNPPVPGID